MNDVNAEFFVGFIQCKVQRELNHCPETVPTTISQSSNATVLFQYFHPNIFSMKMLKRTALRDGVRVPVPVSYAIFALYVVGEPKRGFW